MTHRRQTIRDYVTTLLSDNVAGVSGRIFASRVYAIQRDELPGICVYTLREPAEQISLSGTLQRELELAIDIYERHSESPDDALDALAEAVESTMADERTLGGNAKWNRLAETTIGFAGEGEQANGLARLRYIVTYIT